MLGRRTAFLMIPIGDGQVDRYCDVVSRSSTERHVDLGEVFSDFAEPVSELLNSVAERNVVHSAMIEEVLLDTWVRGRVLLVGDVRMPTSPNMAEGAAMALEDELPWCSPNVCDGSTQSQQLCGPSRPGADRRTDWVRTQTHRRDRTRDPPTAVRNAVLWAFGQRTIRSNYRPLRDEAWQEPASKIS